MTSELDSPRPGPAERTRNRRFYLQVTAATAATVAVAAIGPLAKRLGAPEIVQLIAPFLMLIPLAWGLTVAARFIAKADEWEREVYLVGAGIGFLAVMAAAAVMIALGAIGVVLPLGGWWAIILVGCIAFGVTIAIRSRR